MPARIRKKDKVIVLSGKDKGKTGEVVRVMPKADRVVVQGVNLVTRHQRQTAKSQGGIVRVEAPVHVSNVAHIDPRDNKPTRIAIKTLSDGRKVRVAKRSGEQIDK